MDESSQQGDHKTPKYAAPKDKRCPYCGQAFTSSSLGRHLDLYIRDKNPKAPDGLHDVDEIKKTRGNITRRQPRNSIGGRRDASTPTGTPRAGSRKPSVALESRQSSASGTLPKEGTYTVDSALGKNLFLNPRWETTGVMNDIGESITEVGKRPGLSRTVSRQAAQKAQFDFKHKLTDAMDTARAAELALRELLGSWRAAKQQFDAKSMPFDFDPLSLDFPALTLQCLQPPPTLFSSTQHPTSTSWSIQPPGQRQFSALQTYFEEQFRTWKLACVTATREAVDDIPYAGGPHRDKGELVRNAEKSAENLERQVNEHLHSAFAVWDRLPPPRQNELWVLELARGVGRKHKENEKRKEAQQRLEQEVVHLKSNLDQLNRLQQPREFKIVTPTTVPFERDFMSHAYELRIKGAGATGFDIQDRDADLGTVISRAVERWKNVIVSSRITNGGMGAQKPLDQPNGTSSANGASTPQSRSQSRTPQQQIQSQPSLKRLSTASTSGAASEQATSSADTTAPPSVDDASDQDADADMEDDDSFAMMGHSPTKPANQPPMLQQQRLEIPRTRPPVQHQQHQQHQQQQQQQQQLQQPQQQHQQQQQQHSQQPMPDQRFMMPNSTHSPVRGAALNMSRSMPNMAMAMQSTAMQAAELGMAMHGMHGEQMYLE